jgi:hypothetical protein
MLQTTRSLAILLALSLALATTGCFRYGVSSNVRSDGVVHKQSGPILFWGLSGQDKASPECPNGVASAHSYMPWWGGAGALFTLGIATPWRLEYECARSHASSAAETSSY